MPDDPIARLRGMLEAATPAVPWCYHRGEYTVLPYPSDIDNDDDDSRSGWCAEAASHGVGALIVAAVNSLPALLAVAELAQRMVNLGHDGEAYNRTFIDIEEALAELADGGTA